MPPLRNMPDLPARLVNHFTDKESSGPKRKRGRPRLNPQSQKSQKFQQTVLDKDSLEKKLKLVPDGDTRNLVHPEYTCGWLGCRAKLHNFQTLGNHVIQKHGRGEHFTCRWSGCGKEVTTRDLSSNNETTVHIPEEFTEFKAWSDHVSSKHLNQYKWSHGDGPVVDTVLEGQNRSFQELISDYSATRRTNPVEQARPPPNLQGAAVSSWKRTKAEFTERQRSRTSDGRNGQCIGPFVERGGSDLVTDDLKNALTMDDLAVGLVDTEPEPKWVEWDEKVKDLSRHGP